jgi:NAD+ diphosphatase
MLGFLAEAVSTEINTNLDQELESAVWYTRSEVVAALNKDPNATFSMPPKGSLAATLVHSWINDKKWHSTNAKM